MASCSAQPPNGNGDDNDEYGWKKTLPSCYRFCPTDVELITKYLKRKAQNLKINAGIIRDLDIYNYSPQQLQAYAFNNGYGRMYFFAPLKKKTNEGWRGARTVGGGIGFWKASQARLTMTDSNKIVIGTKQSLVYYNGKANKTSWLMSEFRFPSDFHPLPLFNETRHELALCVIYHHSKRKITDDNQESESNANLMEDLQSPNNLMLTSSPTPNFIATPTQNANHPSSLVQSPSFIAALTLQNPNFPVYSSLNPNFIASSTLQNPNFPSASTLTSNAVDLPPLPTTYNTLSYTDISYSTKLPLDDSIMSFDCSLPWSFDDEEIVSLLNDNEHIPGLDDILPSTNQQTLLYNNTPPQISPNNIVNSNTSTATNHNQCDEPTQQDSARPL